MVYDLLSIGEQNAQSATELARALHCSRREISKMVEAERRNGLPICATSNSSTPGYYIPADRETMQGYCQSLLHRIRAIAQTRSACEKTIEQLPFAKDVQPEGGN